MIGNNAEQNAPTPKSATASAPASIGNVCVGYDVLGLAFDAARDTVKANRELKYGVRLGQVSGLVSSLPSAVNENCALAAANAVLEASGAKFGVRLDIDKKIPLSAGMGGSAASAVAAAGAVNALLDRPFSTLELLPFCLEGERVSSDPPPWDNVAPCLLGGLVITAQLEPALVKRLPLPGDVACVVFHPDRKIETQAARDLLAATVSQSTAVEFQAPRHLCDRMRHKCARPDRRWDARHLYRTTALGPTARTGNGAIGRADRWCTWVLILRFGAFGIRLGTPRTR
jgi:homoserine kinase